MDGKIVAIVFFLESFYVDMEVSIDHSSQRFTSDEDLL